MKYASVVVPSSKADAGDPTIDILDERLCYYEDAAAVASKEGVDVLVYPEFAFASDEALDDVELMREFAVAIVDDVVPPERDVPSSLFLQLRSSPARTNSARKIFRKSSKDSENNDDDVDSLESGTSPILHTRRHLSYGGEPSYSPSKLVSQNDDDDDDDDDDVSAREKKDENERENGRGEEEALKNDGDSDDAYSETSDDFELELGVDPRLSFYTIDDCVSSIPPSFHKGRPRVLYHALKTIAVRNNVACMFNVAECEDSDHATLYNTSFLISKFGNLVGRYRKIHPYFTSTFSPGTTEQRTVFDFKHSSLDGQVVKRMGFMICKDVVHRTPGSMLYKEKPDVVLYPFASGPLGKAFGATIRGWSLYWGKKMMCADLQHGSSCQSGACVKGRWMDCKEIDVDEETGRRLIVVEM